MLIDPENLKAVEFNDDVTLANAGVFGDRVVAVLADVFDAQRERVFGHTGGLAFGRRWFDEPQAAEPHAAQIPGRRAPRNVALSPPARR